MKADSNTEYRPTHEELVQALVKSGNQIANEMTGQDAHLWHMAMGLSGEAGEILDAIKKVVIYQKPIDTLNIIEELGDLEFYMEGLRASLGITREQTIQANIDKLLVRYGKTYSDKAAQERADKS